MPGNPLKILAIILITFPLFCGINQETTLKNAPDGD
jgi:hypothetical protein